MLYGMYLNTAGALVEEIRQDVIANNLANSSTTGYKGDTAIFRARLSEALENPRTAGSRNPLLDRVGGGVFLDEVTHSATNGPLEPSSNSLDLALQGDGFFVVSDGNRLFYTRDGRFRRSSDGTLTTLDGRFRVLDDKGRPLNFPAGEVRVGERGDVVVDGRPFGRLGLAGSSTPGRFEKVGANLYRYTGKGTPDPKAASPEVRQFFLEGSNVNPVQEMVRLIQSHRAYETNMQMIRIQDQTLGQAVNRIARITA